MVQPHETDVQAKTLYAAERKVDWAKYGGDENLEELEAVWVYVQKLINRKSFARRYKTTHARFSVPEKAKPFKLVDYNGKGYIMGSRYRMPTRGDAEGLRIQATSHGGYATRDLIALNKWARQKYIVIHELAHVVDSNENGWGNKPWHQAHGWQFCLIYLELTGLAFGDIAKKELRDSFRNEGVRFLRPRGARNQCPWDPNPDREWVTGE